MENTSWALLLKELGTFHARALTISKRVVICPTVVDAQIVQATPEAAHVYGFAQLEALIGRKVVASGIPGETTAEGLARLDAVLEETKPALVILSHGGNDFLRQLDERQAADNVRAMVRLARARGAQVVLLAVPKPGLVPSPVAFYGDIAKEFGLAYDRDTLTDILTDRELKSDLVHPNAKGYARLAQSIAALLKKSGAV